MTKHKSRSKPPETIAAQKCADGVYRYAPQAIEPYSDEIVVQINVDMRALDAAMQRLRLGEAIMQGVVDGLARAAAIEPKQREDGDA